MGRKAASIADEVKKVAAYVGIAIAVVIFAVILAVIGTSLFVGVAPRLDRLGVLHGVLLFIAIAVACGLAAVGVSAVRIGRSFVIGLLLAIVVGLLMALGLPDQAYTYVGENALPGIEPGVRPLVVGMIIVGAIGLIVGIIARLAAAVSVRCSPGSSRASSSARSQRRRRATRSAPASGSPSAMSCGSR